MSDGTQIEWTEKTCSTCAQAKPVTSFGRDDSRADGFSYDCKPCKNARARERYHPKPRPPRGRRFVDARDDDRKQARRRVNYLVEQGLIPRPNALPCIDCGHQHGPGEKRHEYDHHLGYAPEHHDAVEPVCTTCHKQREVARRG